MVSPTAVAYNTFKYIYIHSNFIQYSNPFVMFDYMKPIIFAQWFCPCGQCHHKKAFKRITRLLLSGLQTTNHTGTLEPSTPKYTPAHTGTRRNFREPTPAHTGSPRNLPKPSSGTAPATRTGTHQILSGLKTPLAYAAGEKTFFDSGSVLHFIYKPCGWFLQILVFVLFGNS